MRERQACDMRGFLSLTILWLLKSRGSLSGEGIAREIEKRKGCKPNPGTIYPALKELSRKKVIIARGKEGKEKMYTLTPKGQAELRRAREAFLKAFRDLLH